MEEFASGGVCMWSLHVEEFASVGSAVGFAAAVGFAGCGGLYRFCLDHF